MIYMKGVRDLFLVIYPSECVTFVDKVDGYEGECTTISTILHRYQGRGRNKKVNRKLSHFLSMKNVLIVPGCLVALEVHGSGWNPHTYDVIIQHSYTSSSCGTLMHRALQKHCGKNEMKSSQIKSKLYL